jgi:hypothetical protein
VPRGLQPLRPNNVVISSDTAMHVTEESFDSHVVAMSAGVMMGAGAGSKCHVWCGGKTGAEEENGTFYNNEISDCTASQVNRSDSRAFVAGTFVWSGFDYLGEARGWPQSVKPRGVITDIAVRPFGRPF